jgi:hypothetical protein
MDIRQKMLKRTALAAVVRVAHIPTGIQSLLLASHQLIGAAY